MSDYVASPTIADFFRSEAGNRIIIGPLGSGKSTGCTVEILRRAMQMPKSHDGIRHSRGVVIRNTKTQLRDTTRKTFEKWIPARLGRWHEQSFTFEMKQPPVTFFLKKAANLKTLPVLSKRSSSSSMHPRMFP